MERSNRRNTISILHRSCLYTFLCAAPKQATGVTMVSKYLKRSRIATFLLIKKGLCAKNAFDAAWRWCAKSGAWLPVLAVQSMHPNHLCVEPRSRTSITCPFLRGTSLGLCDWVVNIFVFPTFKCSPTSAKHVTSSSNKNFVSSNVFAKRRISSANLKSKSVCMPSWKSMPALPTFRRQHPSATSKTHENNRGLNTHPCRTPPLIQNHPPSGLLSPIRPVWP